MYDTDHGRVGMSPFLVVYHRSTGAVSVEQFPDAISAMAARLDRESEVDVETEVVVLSSESDENLRETHSRYFKKPSEILKDSRKLINDTLASA